MSTAILAPGFADPVRDAQRVFRAALGALSRPTLPHDVDALDSAPAPLGRVAAALLLALVDAQAPVWLDDALRRGDEVSSWLAFHTGTPIVDDPGAAAFVIASTPSALPALGDLDAGTDEEPHRSATVIIDAGSAPGTGAFVASGPGVNGSVAWDGAGLPAGFLAEWKANTALYPRGVDMLIAGDDSVRALTRTTVLEPAASNGES